MGDMGVASKPTSREVDATQPQPIGRGTRSASGGGRTDANTTLASRDILRSSSPSQSPYGGRRQRKVTRSNSISKKEHRTRSRSSTQSESFKANPRSSSQDRKSILSQEASGKNGSKGRRLSVHGSLNTFLDEETINSRPCNRNMDSQSVISTASRRRRRSRTPASASIVGRLSMTRKELRMQRLSSSPGSLDKMMESKRLAIKGSYNQKWTSEDSDRGIDSIGDKRSQMHTGYRSRDSNKSSCGTGKKRSESCHVRTRSSSVSTRQHREAPSLSRTPTKSRSAGIFKTTAVEALRSASSVAHAGTKTITKATFSSGTSAEIPPGFPIAAVDSCRILTPSKTEPSLNKALNGESSSSVLESTARLKRRQSCPEEGFGCTTYRISANSAGGEKNRRNRRRLSLIGNAIDADMRGEKENALSGDVRVRRTSLEQSRSESGRSGTTKPIRRQDNHNESLSPLQQTKLMKDSLASNQVLLTNKQSDSLKNYSRAGEPRKAEKMRSTWRSRHPGALPDENPSHSIASPSLRAQEGNCSGWWDLSKANDQKSSDKPKKKSTSPSLASISSFDTIHPINGAQIVPEYRKYREHKLERFHSSTGSLDLGLLADSPSTHIKISNEDLFLHKADRPESADKDDDISQNSCNLIFSGRPILGSLEKNSTRVSWIELPIFDPEQLLVKSTDPDGANEISQLSTPARSTFLVDHAPPLLTKISLTSEQQQEEKKTNPSLRDAIEKDNAEEKKKGSQDGRTVVTTTTSNTNTSDLTTKTNNRDPTRTKSAKLRSKDEKLLARHDSMSLDQLDVLNSEEQRSSSSLSRSSQRSNRTDSSIVKDKIGSWSESSSGTAGKTRARRSSKDLKTATSREKSKQMDGHSGLQWTKSGHINIQRTVNSAVTTSLDEDCHCHSTKKPSAESPGTISRKKTYLNKRRVVKADQVESLESKKVVNSSLDTFLKRIEQAPPVVKDENRSVYSYIQEKDRNKRTMDIMQNATGKRLTTDE